MIYRLKYLLVVILLLSGTASASPQSADNGIPISVSGKFVKPNLLDKMEIPAPQIYAMAQGKRVKLRIYNGNDREVKNLRFYLYYNLPSGGKKRIKKLLLPPLEAKENYHLCVNVNYPLHKNEYRNLTIRLKRRKTYRDYEFTE